MGFEVKDVGALRKTERQLVAGLECHAGLEQGLTIPGSWTAPGDLSRRDSIDQFAVPVELVTLDAKLVPSRRVVRHIEHH